MTIGRRARRKGRKSTKGEIFFTRRKGRKITQIFIIRESMIQIIERDVRHVVWKIIGLTTERKAIKTIEYSKK
jgi:hypothetical protein